MSSIWLSISESDLLNSWKKHHCKVKGHPDHHFDGNILLLMDSIVLYPRILNCFLFIGHFINITKISFDLRVSRHFLSMWKKEVYIYHQRDPLIKVWRNKLKDQRDSEKNSLNTTYLPAGILISSRFSCSLLQAVWLVQASDYWGDTVELL